MGADFCPPPPPVFLPVRHGRHSSLKSLSVRRHHFILFLHNGSASFSYTNAPDDFLIYSSSALICNIRQLLLLTHALLNSLLRLLNLQEKVCQSEKALQHRENKNVLSPSQALTQYLLLQACFRGPLLRVDQPSPAGQSTTSR